MARKKKSKQSGGGIIAILIIGIITAVEAVASFISAHETVSVIIGIAITLLLIYLLASRIIKKNCNNT